MQAKINSFFKPKSPDPYSSSDDFLNDKLPKRPPIRTTYERRPPNQRRRDEIGEESIKETPESPISVDSSLKPTAPTAGRSLNRKRSYAQLHLELGQSDFLLRTCCACGLKYAAGDETDEKVHSTFHKNFTHGVQFKGWRNERVVHIPPGDVDRVVLVLNGDPPAHRNKVRDVVEMMEIDFGTGWVLHDLCKAYLLISSHRIAGCLIAESIKCAYKVISSSANGGHHNNAASTANKTRSISTTLQFGNVSFQREVVRRAPSVNARKMSNTELNGATFCENEAVPALCGVRAIWVSPSNRRKGIATHLLDAVRKDFQTGFVLEHSQLAFSQPTTAGKALASRYTGSGSFLVYQTSSSDS